jgi:hypothetical protein
MQRFSIEFPFGFLKPQYTRIADKPKANLLKRPTNDERNASRGLFLGVTHINQTPSRGIRSFTLRLNESHMILSNSELLSGSHQNIS